MNTKLIIAPDAVEKIKDFWSAGVKKSAFYFINGEKVGYRWWDKNQWLCMEYGIKNEHMHGLFRTWHDNGKLSEEGFYVDGKEHGITKQYDFDGNLIGTDKMHYGTGVDLWYSEKGILSEERYLKNGDRDGYERWWNGDNKRVSSENHFQAGVEHGIYRQWNHEGSLRRGFPQYYVNGQKVNKK
jgi:antitoxin component YwqK of YwqJK toxin-antitoxin module